MPEPTETMYSVTFTAPQTVELVASPPPGPLASSEVSGNTLVSLISAGTELNSGYYGRRQHGEAEYPTTMGYAAVFQVAQVGSEVENFKPGDLALCMGKHTSFQRVRATEAVRLPDGLSPELAPYARLMGVTMTTLMTTAARPGDRVLVTGAGPVGFLGAQLFAINGYDVWVAEPNAVRRNYLTLAGLPHVFASAPVDDPTFVDSVALGLECSGHEAATRDLCRVVRKRGEVALVGVPWARHTEIYAHDILSEVFHRYIVLRSGWEWEIPRHTSDFHPHSNFRNLQLALQWLADGQIYLDGMTRILRPAQAQEAYDTLAAGTVDELYTIFDWRV